ncbi:MAG: efflux RND transporter permease subunit [Planctomycetota bacterium]|jgi:predicted RND superfamily exporter protein
MTQTILRHCGRFACTHYRLVLCLAFLLTVLSLLPIFQTRTRFSASVRKLMPSDNASARAFNRALNDFGTADEVLIVIRVKDGSEVGTVGRYAIQLAETLREHPDFADAYCRYIRPDEKGFLEEEILSRGLLYLPPEGVEEVKALLSEKQIRRNVKKTFKRLSTPMTEDKERLIRLNTLNFLPVFKKHLASSFDNFSAAGHGNLMVGPGATDTMILVAAQPNGPAQRLEYASRIMEIVRHETWSLFGEGKGWVSESEWWKPWTWGKGHEALAGTLPPALKSQVVVEFAGGYEAAVRYTSHISGSLSSTLMTSLIGVLLIFGYFYRRYGVIFYVGVPLVMVVCWTVGAGYVIFGKINMISSAFAAVLVGLGVDYAIHIYNRYIEERNRGVTVEEAFVLSLEHTGRGVVVGMLTTSTSFFALHVTRFKGLSQFGTLAGVGLALALPAMLFVLPAMVVWRSKRGGGENERALCSTTFLLPWLAGVVERHARPIAVVGVLVALLSGSYAIWGENSVRFDERLASLRPSKDRVFVLGEEIAKRFTRKSPARQMLLVTGDTEAEALNNASQLLPKLERLKADGELKDFEILTQRLPAPAQQYTTMESLAAVDFDQARSILRAELDRLGLEESAFTESFDFLNNHQALSQTPKAILPSGFKGTPLWRLVRRLVARHKVSLYLNGEVSKVLRAGKRLQLAKAPASRDGNLYLHQNEPVTIAALNYLKLRGVLEVSVREPEGPAASTRTLESLRTQIQAGSQIRFAETLLDDKGLPLVDVGAEVTLALADFLRQSDCRKVYCIAEGYTVLGYIYPPNDQLKGLELEDGWVRSVRDRLGVNDKTILLTGTMLVAHDLATIVKDDFFKISVAVTMIAAFVLILCYREFYRVVFSLLPIILALLYLVGVMSVGSIYFNFINVLVVPVIIGLGVDNGIHLVHRFYDDGGDIRRVIVDTGRAIVITNLTSMFGFGSLWVGSYSGLQSMGMLSVLGLTMSITASLLVLPALLVLFLGKRLKKDEPAASLAG